MKRFTYALLALAAIAVVYFSGCKKDDTNDSDTSIATDNYRAEQEADGIVDAMYSAAVDNDVMRIDESTNTLLPSCAPVTIDTLSTPKTMTIQFDNAGCLCSDWDNKVRKGKIIATWTGRYRDAGTVINITTQDYYVDGNKYEINKTITNNGLNAGGHPTFSIHVTQGKVTYNDGTAMTWTSDRTREWVQGSGTLTPYDDVYSITGNASGTSRNGTAFTLSITNPLIKAISCYWIQQGTLVIEPDGKATRTLDFGDGTCDAKATVTINGTVYNLTL